MKRIILAATSAIALAATAGAASAAETAQININAEVASKCGIKTSSSLISLTDITGTDAKVRSDVTADIATKLNEAKVIPFCNKANSTVKVERAVLTLAGGTTGLAAGGYAQAVRYNLDASIGNVALDTTSVAGASTVAQPFGGHTSEGDVNTHIKFVEAVQNGKAVATVGNFSPVATDWGANTDRRLIAGSYTGYVTIELTPGA